MGLRRVRDGCVGWRQCRQAYLLFVNMSVLFDLHNSRVVQMAARQPVHWNIAQQQCAAVCVVM